MRGSRFFGALLALTFVLALTLKMELLFGWSFDLVLATLVAFAVVVSGPAIIILTGLSLWILNWQQGFGPELLVLAAAPLLAALSHRFQPWRSALTPAVVVAIGTLGFYLAAHAPLSLHAWFLVGDIAICILFAYILIWIFRVVWNKRSKPVNW